MIQVLWNSYETLRVISESVLKLVYWKLVSSSMHNCLISFES